MQIIPIRPCTFRTLKIYAYMRYHVWSFGSFASEINKLYLCSLGFFVHFFFGSHMFINNWLLLIPRDRCLMFIEKVVYRLKNTEKPIYVSIYALNKWIYMTLQVPVACIVRLCVWFRVRGSYIITKPIPSTQFDATDRRVRVLIVYSRAPLKRNIYLILLINLKKKTATIFKILE